jgi:hypothetical protein
MEAGGVIDVQKSGSRRRNFCTENMEAGGGRAVQRYGSRRRDG